MKREQAHQILAEFAHELRQLLKRYPQVEIDRADGYFTNLIVKDDQGNYVRDSVHCSELLRASDEERQTQ